MGIQPLKNGGISRGYFMWKPLKIYAIISFIIWDTIFTHSGCGCENGPLKYPDGDFFDGDVSRFFPPKNGGLKGFQVAHLSRLAMWKPSLFCGSHWQISGDG